MVDSKIEWTGSTWNPVSGCSKVSQGCKNCYAETVTKRFPSAYPNGFAVTLRPAKLEDPLRWKKPRLIFVNSMSDLFHHEIPGDFLRAIWDVMARAHWHTFQVLTKRDVHMRDWLAKNQPSPLPNVWIGVSVESGQHRARLQSLADTPAAVRFASFEPLVGSLGLAHDNYGLSWAIFGGESGPGARPLDLDWIRDGLAWSRGLGVRPFVKQLGTAWASSAGARHPKGGDPEEWPADLRVREMPRVA